MLFSLGDDSQSVVLPEKLMQEFDNIVQEKNWCWTENYGLLYICFRFRTTLTSKEQQSPARKKEIGRGKASGYRMAFPVLK